MSDTADYRFAWHDYRRRVLWFFGEWLGGFLAIAAVAQLVSILHANYSPWIFALLVAAWMLGFHYRRTSLDILPLPSLWTSILLGMVAQQSASKKVYALWAAEMERV